MIFVNLTLFYAFMRSIIMKFVVIGGDAAGMSAASRAKRLDPKSEITVFEQTHDVSYSACGMPYNIADPQTPIDKLIVRRAEVFREKQGIDLYLAHRVTAIDRTAKIISGVKQNGQSFECAYDKLLIATGASPIIPSIAGADNKGVLPLKTLDDGRILKDYVGKKSVKRAVIIGMGYIALEMAESLRKREIEVAMVKPRPRILPWMNEELAKIVISELEENNVELHAGYNPVSIEAGDRELTLNCDGLALKSQLILPAIGVTPNSQLAADAGLKLGLHDSISVDRCTRTSDPDIYSAGDCADVFNVITGKKDWVPLALIANRAGRVTADNIFGQKLELQGIAGTSVFKVFSLQVARSGLTVDEAHKHGFDPVEITIESRSRAHGHAGNKTIHVAMVGDKKSGRLLGAQMVGQEGAAHRINSIAVALHNHMTVADFWQTDLAYAPPFSPVWDPLLTAANQLARKL